jgi:hypothetical protein
MHEDNRFQAALDDAAFSLDSEESEDISVLGGYFMGLNWVLEVFAVSSDVEVCFWMACRQPEAGSKGEDCHKEESNLHKTRCNKIWIQSFRSRK